MNKLSKRFLFAAGSTTALVVLFLVGLDAYSGSDAVRGRLETLLSKQSGLPVKVGSVHFTPWGGLVAQAVAVAPPAEGGGNDSTLGVPQISARLAWLPLLSHRLLVERLTFTEPTLLWVQNAEGGWNLPCKRHPAVPETLPAAPGALANGGTGTIQPQALPPPTPAASLPVKPRKKREFARLEFKIRAAHIENATLRLVDHEGESVAVLEGVNVDCPGGVQGDIEGYLLIRKTTLRDGVTLEELKTPFALKEGTLTLPALEARLAGGTVRGKGGVSMTQEHPPFTLDLLFDSVDIHALQIQVEGDQLERKSTGTLHGSLDLYGLIGKKKSIVGTGQLRLHNGRMEQLPLFQMIGKSLSIEELTNLELQQAQLDLRAGEGKVYVDSLVMESPNLSLTATGTSGFNGKLNLAARLAVTSKITRQLPSSVEANFQPVPGSDRKAIGFRITGTLSRPQSDIMRVLVGQKIESELLNVFRTLTGKPKKKSSASLGTAVPPATEDADPSELLPAPQPTASPAP